MTDANWTEITLTSGFDFSLGRLSGTVAEGAAGQIVTFYSFKGGVGRSRALANVAYQLARRGKRVLCIDLDLEAPGLASYFKQWISGEPEAVAGRQGMIDLFYSYKEYLLLPGAFRAILDWRRLIQKLDISEQLVGSRQAADELTASAGEAQTGGGQVKAFSLDFIGPGNQTADYGDRVVDFDWRAFYENWHGGKFIEHLREQFRAEYDYVLIDSRTGVSDIGGICTIQFPTILVLVFSSSPQSISGLEGIIDGIQIQHAALRGDEPVPIIPLPARIDRKEERAEYEKWFEKVAEGRLGGLLAPFVQEGMVRTTLQKISVDYVPWYSFFDALESNLEATDDPGSNASRYKSLVDLISEVSTRVETPRRVALEVRWDKLAEAQNRINDDLKHRPDSFPSRVPAFISLNLDRAIRYPRQMIKDEHEAPLEPKPTDFSSRAWRSEG
jgi:MinD-like ATPase involved in chromosome partitioning or flagellar assembly